MNAESEAFHIVVGVDYSELSREALHEAQRQAALHEHTVIHALHVAAIAATYSHGLLPAAPLLADGRVPYALDRLERFVARERDRFRQSSGGPTGQVDLISHLRIADPSDDIVQLATDLPANLIVVGTHGRTGLARWLLGSVAENVVSAAPCPVLVVRESGAVAHSQKVRTLAEAHAA